MNTLTDAFTFFIIMVAAFFVTGEIIRRIK